MTDKQLEILTKIILIVAIVNGLAALICIILKHFNQ
jgi:hypothetical protein